LIHTLQRNGKASIAVAAVAPGGVAIVASGSIKAISGMTILLIIAILPFLDVFVMMANCEISTDEPAVVEIQINGGAGIRYHIYTLVITNIAWVSHYYADPLDFRPPTEIIRSQPLFLQISTPDITSWSLELSVTQSKIM